MKHPTTDKGDIGIAKVTASLLEQGIPVFMPISATCPFDMLALIKGKFKRIQIKYRNGNVLNVALKRNIIHNGKVKSKKNIFVDYLAIYSPITDKCYYINCSKFDKCISIRINETKNNQKTMVNNGKDFLKLK